jgi:hypothetical protein
MNGLKNAEEYLLRRIFCLGRIAKHAQAQTKNLVLVHAYELLEGTLITALEREDQAALMGSAVCGGHLTRIGLYGVISQTC